MSETNALRVSRLLQETAGFLLPLTQTEIDVEVTRIELDLDLRSSAAALGSPAGLAGAVVLVTEAVDSVAGLNAIRSRFAGAAALIVPPGTHTHLGEGTSASALPILLERSTGVTWSEVLVHLRQLNEGAASALAWPDVDDLSALAAVIAEMTGASITIEDPASRVLAHSNLGDEIDDIRRETILSGAIPQWRIAELEESGFLDVVRRSTDVVERRAAGASPARSVIALRSEGELLGTIWAAYPDSLDPASLRDVLRDAARAALPVMLRTLRRSPFEKRIRREALGSILGGSPDLGPAATLLALPFSGHYATLAFAEVAPDREPVLRFHLRAAFADAVLAHVGSDGHLAVLVHMSEGMEAADIRSHVASALQRSLSPSQPLHFGVGVGVERLDLVHRSWTEAVYVLDALLTRSKSGATTSAGSMPAGNQSAGNESAGATCADDQSMVRGATAEDVAAELVGLEAADALRSVGPRITEPARLLAEHDAKHQGQLLETLRVYFATVGNSAEASRRLHVHTNSLRHRLSRIEEITGLSTADRSGRLWLELAVLVFDRKRA